ncbi:MAG: hypothetical protein AB8B79_08670 [Granulosicoccus sp.]
MSWEVSYDRFQDKLNVYDWQEKLHITLADGELVDSVDARQSV